MASQKAQEQETSNAKDEVGDDIVSGVVCNVVKHASGAVAQAIATLVLIITGYSFLIKVGIALLCLSLQAFYQKAFRNFFYPIYYCVPLSASNQNKSAQRSN